MSATMYPRMPTIGNPSPWEQALATTKQDTGTGWTRGGFTPRMEDGPGSAFTAGGSTWNLPDWAWGGNQLGGGTYDQASGTWRAGAPLAAGADVFGARLPVGYNSAGDRGGLEYNGQHGETFWSRMLRFARDYTMGGVNPQQAMQQALDRIRRDNGGTLAGTGFDEGGGTVASAGGLPNGGMSVDYGTGATGQGGGTVADVNGGGGTPRPVGGTYSPNGGTSTTTPGGGIGTMGGNPLYNYGLALNGTAQDRARLIGEANGRTSPAHGRLAEFATNLYANALKAYLMISQLGGGAAGANPQAGVGDMNSFLAAMQGGGGGMIPLLQGAIGQGLGGDLGQDPETQEQAYRAALALRSLYSGGLASDVAGQHLDDAMWQQGASVDRNPLGGGMSLVDILNQANSPYKANLNQYLGLR